MLAWEDLLRRPSQFSGTDDLDSWFGQIAERLINSSVLLVAGEPHRFVEIEFYYHGNGHLDPFAHRDPLQMERGRWYFHRSGGTLRGGSFKGVDLTFGDGTAHAGVLIRGIETESGTRIDGPSLTVDALLRKTGEIDVASLDQAVGTRTAWEPGNPLHLREATVLPARNILRTARVGLSLKKVQKTQEPTRYLMKPYRYLSDPRRTAKGKLHMVLALHSQGVSPDEIQKRTGCPQGAVSRYIAEFKAGQLQPDFEPYYHKDLSTEALCRLYGVWYANFGNPKIGCGLQPKLAIPGAG